MISRYINGLGIALVIMIWGVTFASTRVLLEDFSALEIQVIRFGLAWLVLWLASACRSAKSSFRSWRDEALFAGMGLSGVALYQFLENCAIYYTNASNVAILVSFGPIVTALMSQVLTKSRQLSARLVGGSIVSVCGVSLVSLNGITEFELRPIGDMMALCAMLSWGLYSILIDVANERGINPLVAVRKSFGWSLTMMIPVAIWGMTESGICALDGSFAVIVDVGVNLERFSNLINWMNIAFLGLLASAASFVLWSVVCRAFGVVKTTISLYLTPIVGVIFAAVFLGEKITMLEVAGGVIILIGVAIATAVKGGVK